MVSCACTIQAWRALGGRAPRPLALFADGLVAFGARPGFRNTSSIAPPAAWNRPVRALPHRTAAPPPAFLWRAPRGSISLRLGARIASKRGPRQIVIAVRPNRNGDRARPRLAGDSAGMALENHGLERAAAPNLRTWHLEHMNSQSIRPADTVLPSECASCGKINAENRAVLASADARLDHLAQGPGRRTVGRNSDAARPNSLDLRQIGGKSANCGAPVQIRADAVGSRAELPCRP